MPITEVIRQDIIDTIVASGIQWSGRMEEPDFLERVFAARDMPSYDTRFGNAYGDIWQHRVNNLDWEDDWIFRDTRFNLLNCDEEVFLKFLCEMLHPAVQPDPNIVDSVRDMLDFHLRQAGYELTERTRIAGRPVFSVKPVTPASPIAGIRTVFDELDTQYISRQLARMEAAVNEDTDLAIGTAKELVETCCRTILLERNIQIQGNPDLSQLVKQTTSVLALTPGDIPDQAKAVETVRRLLSNLATITQGIAELRNHYGTGHGKHAKSKGLQPRHARLAVGAASTLVVFLVETHKTRTIVKPQS